MKTLSSLLLLIPLLSFTANADQLAYLLKSDAMEVEQLLRQRELLVTFCSECNEDCVTVWHINHVEARYNGYETYYQIYVSAWPLVKSIRPVANDELPGQVAMASVTPESLTPETFPIDLAYAYIWHETHWKCIGKLQEMPCDVRVQAFRL